MTQSRPKSVSSIDFLILALQTFRIRPDQNQVSMWEICRFARFGLHLMTCFNVHHTPESRESLIEFIWRWFDKQGADSKMRRFIQAEIEKDYE